MEHLTSHEIEIYLRQLGSGDARDRSKALTILAANATSACQALRHLARSRDSEPSARAFKALADLASGYDCKPALDTLIALLNDGRDFVRMDAADALADLGKDAVPALPVLAAMVRSDGLDDEVRTSAIGAALSILAACHAAPAS